ncbi:RNA pyrophosphohydrolase [Litorimonas sp. WD9-15]|uniref:RNA pyrophosphohydrolase n=1 Tax=Litorimonas sp. WD9-15 TaxID=3418716 RepID=UPI003D07D891
MSRNKKDYRRNVGVVIFNAQGQVWLGKRYSEDGPYCWQFPQGGMDKGEKPKAAAKRELFEETGLKADRMDYLGRIKGWLYYDFPPELLAQKRKRFNNIGQRQKWFAFRYHGDGADVDLTAHGEQEFSDWRWADLNTIADTIVPFKREVYERLIVEFAPFAKPIQ